jgi:general secretion pathway protein D
VTLEVEPVVGSDGQTIDLNLAPQVVEFDGFINYGSPIYGPPSENFNLAGVFTGFGPPTILTPNVINQPIFDTRKSPPA